MKPQDDAGPIMYAPGMGVFLNLWCATYDEAHALRESQGGYLLPFRHQFFVTGPEGIAELGLDPHDPNWERIGWDWARPRDWEAWTLLRDLRRRALSTGSGASVA